MSTNLWVGMEVCLSYRSAKSGPLVLGAVVPSSGAAGVWGPSTRACAELATAEINRAGGIEGRELCLHLIDAAHGFVDRVDKLITAQALDGIVAMHTSDLRDPLRRAIDSRIPYIYTPLYEGGENSSDVFCIGETPAQQLPPALDWLSREHHAKRWFVIGNDYVWPRKVHCQFKAQVKPRGLQLLGERYLPMGSVDYEPIFEQLRQLKPDAVLLSLVGQDNIRFNRAFAKAGLQSHCLRLSCALDESLLLGIGASCSERLFAVSGYFSKCGDKRNGLFRESYHQHFGERCPPLNAIGHSVYEGVRFFEQLRHCYGDDWHQQQGPMLLQGARGAVFEQGSCRVPSMYLAEAQGVGLNIQQVFY